MQFTIGTTLNTLVLEVYLNSLQNKSVAIIQKQFFLTELVKPAWRLLQC